VKAFTKAVSASAPVVHERNDLLAAVFRRPVAHDHRRLAEREAGAHHERRAVDRDRCARDDHHGGDFRLRDKLGERERGRRDAREHDVDLVVDDHFLHDAACYVRHPRVLAHDQLDLLAGDPVAVELHVELGARERLAADRLEAAGQRQASADLDDVLRGCVAHSGSGCGTGSGNSLQHVPAQHVSLPILLLIQAVGRQV
jgi:hypothetical protein